MISGNQDTSFNKLKTINRRMFIFSAAKAVILFGIVGRLFSLQINDNKKYLTLSDKNRLRETRLPPIRGEFKDYFGNTIAGNFVKLIESGGNVVAGMFKEGVGGAFQGTGGTPADGLDGMYLYIASGTDGGTDGAYTAGKIVIRLYGVKEF